MWNGYYYSFIGSLVVSVVQNASVIFHMQKKVPTIALLVHIWTPAIRIIWKSFYFDIINHFVIFQILRHSNVSIFERFS